MKTPNGRASGYRWVVLAAFCLLNLVVEMNWLTFAPITKECMAFYNTPAMTILALSMSFMVLYLFASVPASYVIDTYGVRIGVGVGAVLTAVFGLVRGMYGSNLTMVFASQLALGVGQPFVLNAITKVAATWFPARERATANGFPVLAQFVGIIIAFLLSPLLLRQTVVHGATLYNIPRIVMFYGYASLLGAIPFLMLARKAPTTGTDEVAEVESPRFRQGLGQLLRQRDMILLALMFFIGLGLFNAISTLIELILIPKGLGKIEAGQVGAIMMVGGIIGAGLLPSLSDRLQRRKELLVLCLVGLVPGLAGLTFAVGYGQLLISGFVFGFFLIGAAPIGFQYGAEVSHPVPEATSQGMILLAGQVGGILFITLVGLMGHLSIESLAGVAHSSTRLTFFMLAFVALAIANVFVCLMLKKPPTPEVEQR